MTSIPPPVEMGGLLEVDIMNNRIQSCVKALYFATREDIYRVLKEDGRVNKQLVNERLADLIKEDVLFEVLPEENELGVEGFIPGPNLDVEVDVNIQKKIIELGIPKRGPGILDVDKISERIEKKLSVELKDLKNNIIGVYYEPRRLELDYFSLMIKYYSWRRYFYENFNHMPFEDLKTSLDECRSLLDNLQIE